MPDPSLWIGVLVGEGFHPVTPQPGFSFALVTLQLGPSFHIALTEVCIVKILEAFTLGILHFVLCLFSMTCGEVDLFPFPLISLVIPLKIREVEDIGDR